MKCLSTIDCMFHCSVQLIFAYSGLVVVGGRLVHCFHHWLNSLSLKHTKCVVNPMNVPPASAHFNLQN